MPDSLEPDSCSTGRPYGVEGYSAMDARIVIPLAFTLVSHTATVPQVHGAVNSGNYEVIVAGLPVEGHVQLKALTRADRAGLLRVSIDVEASRMRCGAPRSLAR